MRGFFYLNRTDRRVVVAVLLVAVAAAGLLLCAGYGAGESPAGVAGDAPAVAAGGRKGSAGHTAGYAEYTDGRRTELSYFDPNTADSTQLLRLGLAPWQVRNIYKYRAKGGIYRTKADFARLYGLTAQKFKELEPYIRIEGDYRPASEVYGGSTADLTIRDTTRHPVKIKPGEHIVLNTADTSQLKRVPGIGSGFARAIVSYGRRLGGYVSVEQLREIDNFPESAIAYFVVKHPVVSRLNLNRLPLSSLRRHPYIGFYQAKTIIEYRRLHGRINSLDDLKLCKDFTPEAIERLRPYVEF